MLIQAIVIYTHCATGLDQLYQLKPFWIKALTNARVVDLLTLIILASTEMAVTELQDIETRYSCPHG